MADTNIYLQLKSNGAEVKGESIVTGHEGWIELLSLNHGVSTVREGGTGMATGRKRHETINITKYVDGASPLLWKALDNNEVVEGVIHFLRGADDVGGAQYYTMEFDQGRVHSVRTNGSATGRATETISLVYNLLTYIYDGYKEDGTSPGGVVHSMSAHENV